MLPTHRNARYHTPVLTAGAAIGFGYGLGRWRIVLALMALTMCVCFVMFFFLPENSAIRQPILDKPIPVNEFLLPNVPHHRDIVMQKDIHVQQDRERLEQKIQKGEDAPAVILQLDQPDSKVAEDENRPQQHVHEIVNQQQVENMIQRVENIESSNHNDGVNNKDNNYGNGDTDENNIHIDANVGKDNNHLKGAAARVPGRAVNPNIQGIPPDEETRQRREKVKEMMAHAWNNYVKYAWGENELKPISKRGHSAGIFGESKQGATIVDGMDTLYLMGMTEEFEKGRQWIENNLDLKEQDTEISVFETNIRFVGGLLTLYAFTNDEMFKRKADEIATALLPAFRTPTGIPYALIIPKTQKAKNYGWSSGGCSILAEFGTMQLEFDYLSEVTGKPIFREKVTKVRQKIYEVKRADGLYPNYLHPKTGVWGQDHISLGALGDSFYEYLLKAYMQTDGEDAQAKEMFLSAMDSVEKHLLKRSEKDRLLYLSEMRYGKNDAKMDHLTCFAGGLFGLASTYFEDRADRYMQIGAELTNTCHESYNRSDTGLGPESFRFSAKAGDAKAIRFQDKYYILRPEVIESYFYLWRLTKDRRYRDWGWEAVQAIEKYCRVDGGYTGIKDVYNRHAVKDDVQQSFFLAETLKYLYLLFSEDDLLPLDEWVFNTEAHPLPIRNRNPIYKSHQ